MAVVHNGRGMGFRRQLPDIRDFRLHEKVALPDVGTLPPLIDLRAELPPAWDQGQEGSCTAFSVGAAYRHARRKRHAWPLPAAWSDSIHYGTLEDYTPSMAQIYWCTRSIEGSQAYDSGATIRDAIKSLNQYGAAAWHNMPYVAGDYATPPSPTVLRNASHHEVAHYYALDGTVTQYHQALALKLLPVLGVTVYDSFYQSEVGGYVPMPQAGERVLGGHAQVIVGIDVPNQRFISRNSWGTGYGDNGYLYFDFAYILDPNLTSDPWCIDMGAV